MNRQAWQDAYGEPSAAFDRRLDQTLMNLKKEKKMKRISLRAVIIAAVITVLSIGVVYAAVTGRWSVADYYSDVFGRKAPEGFTSGFDQKISLTAGNVTLSLRDAFADGPVVYLLGELKTSDGTPGFFTMADVSPDDLIGDLYLDEAKKNDTRTIREAAAQAGGKLYEVSLNLCATTERGEDHGDECLDFWIEDDSTFVQEFEKNLLFVPESDVELSISLTVVPEGGEKETASVTVTLPVKEKDAKTILIDKPVEGTPIVLDTMTVVNGKMSNFYSLAWHFDDTVTEEQAAEMDMWFELLDDSLSRLPEGAVTSCGIGDGEEAGHYTQEYMSTPADLTLDHLILRAYAPMEDGKPRYGSVTVDLK